MELFEILKQFKRINPDAAYREKSKRAILAQTPKEPWSARRTIMGIFETGIAVALAGFFILVLTGKFFGSNYIAPVQFSVINPDTLHAEAQAIDIQIQLANLTYQASSTSGSGASTPQIAAAIIAKQPTLLMAKASSTVGASSTAPSAASSTPSSTISIDQALQELSN